MSALMLIMTELEARQWVVDTRRQIKQGLGLPLGWDDMICLNCPEPIIELDEDGDGGWIVGYRD